MSLINYSGGSKCKLSISFMANKIKIFQYVTRLNFNSMEELKFYTKREFYFQGGSDSVFLKIF